MYVLAAFDVLRGHKVVWTDQPAQLDAAPHIEFKVIPSGLHERDEDAVYFVCGKFHGIARYACRRPQQPSDRRDVHMYSLASLVPLSQKLPWHQEFLLKNELAKFLRSLDLQVLRNDLRITTSRVFGDQCHPILALNMFMHVYGPSMFAMWKAGLSRQRTLLAPISGVSLRHMCQFTYIGAQISAIPEDVAVLLPCWQRYAGYQAQGHQRQAGPSVPSLETPNDLADQTQESSDSVPVAQVQCLYNVTLNDLQFLQSADSFWATTTDLILLSPQRDACDCYIEPDKLVDLSWSTEVFSSYRDRHRYRHVIGAYSTDIVPRADPESSEPSSLESTLPSSVSKSGASNFSSKFDMLLDSCVNGLVWWATAGESARIEEVNPRTQESDAVRVIGHFQDFTRQLIRHFSRVHIEDEEVVQLTITDMALMGLDAFSKSDKIFINRFSLAWFDKPVQFGCTCCM